MPPSSGRKLMSGGAGRAGVDPIARPPKNFVSGYLS